MVKSNKRPVYGLLGTFAYISIIAASPSSAVPANAKDPMSLPATPGRILVQPAGALELQQLGAKHKVSLRWERDSLFGWQLLDAQHLSGEELTVGETHALATELSKDMLIKSAQVDRIYKPLLIPNDPGFEQMWHLDAIGADDAWDESTGLASQRIGVVDTGTLRQHEDLSDKAVAGWDFISNSNAAGDGNGRDEDYTDEGDAADCGYGPQGSSWHGSHVAGTILASTDNEAGIAGINWNAKLVTVRALGKCGGSLVDIMEGAAWLVGASIDGVDPLAVEDRVSVMNLSLGGPGACSNFEQQYVNFIMEQGVSVVAASGNDGGSVGSPANCAGVITVAASGPNGSLANYSSFGPTVDVVAPGGQQWNALSQGVLSASGPGNSDYQWNQGTSMAAPHVTGAISLLQAMSPELDVYEMSNILNVTGDSCADCSGKAALRLDKAMEMVVTGEVPEPLADDVYSGNDSPANAALIECGETYDLVIVPGGEDWFQVNAEPGDVVTIDVSAEGLFDIDLYVTTDLGATSVGRSTTETGDESVLVLSPESGNLEVSVLSYDGAQGEYQMTIDCEDLDDTFEPNNSIEEAKPLECWSSHELFLAPEDRDWFALDIARAEPFVLRTVSEGTFDLSVYITTGPTFDDVVASSTEPGANEEVRYTRGEESAILAVVTPPQQGGSGKYGLELECPDREKPVVEEPVEPEPEPEDNVMGPDVRTDIDPRTPPTGGCFGCSQAGDAAPVFFGMALLLLRRRRR